jgi:hypothetical protein
MSTQPPESNDLLKFIASTIEAMRDQMATVSDIARLEARMDRLQDRLGAEATAIRGDIERVHLRLDTIERALTTRLDQVETEISRIRSVVYLLVKDKPELLRILGWGPVS